MIITKKAISRRTILRGLGASVALPLLDAMVPALTAAAATPAKPTVRFGAVYVPNGVVPARWFPTTEGPTFVLTPTLEPLAPFRDRLLVLSGLNSTPPPQPGERVINDHADASTRFLTDVCPSHVLRAGPSADQLAAKVLGQNTQLPSIELALESIDSGTTCDVGRSCIYTGTISWADATTPLPMETDPRAVFERLFGDSETTDAATRRARMEEKASLLDSILGEVSRLKNRISADDRSKVTQYLDAVRDVEQRIEKATQQNPELPVKDRPSGIPATYEEHAKLMFDLQVLAYQGDLTRVTTFMLGREFSGRTYPEIGVPEAHHPMSHHMNDPVRLEKHGKINVFHVVLLTYLLQKLAEVREGDSSLLDQIVLLYGAGMHDGNDHGPVDLPLLLLGGAAGQIRGGRHIRYAKGTPLANLHVTLLDKLGVPIETLGNSTGRLELEPLPGI